MRARSSISAGAASFRRGKLICKFLIKMFVGRGGRVGAVLVLRAKEEEGIFFIKDLARGYRSRAALSDSIGRDNVLSIIFKLDVGRDGNARSARCVYIYAVLS